MTAKRDPTKLTDTERADRSKAAKDHAAWAARLAEYEGSQSVADIVAQLRRRSRIANIRAMWVLGVLVTAVLFGLAAYVVWPVARQYVDGQRAELQRTLEAIDAVDQDLSRDRADIIASMRGSLSSLGDLIASGVPFDRDNIVITYDMGHFDLRDGSVIVYGQNGDLLRIDESEGVVEQVLTGEPRPFIGHVALSNGTYLLYGPEKVFRLNADGKTYERLFLDKGAYFSEHAVLEDGSVLVFGDHTVLVVEKDGELANRLTSPSDFEYAFSLPLGDGNHVLYGWQGVLLVEQNLKTATVIATMPNVYFWQHVQLDDGTFVILGDGGIVRIDERGEVTRSIAFGATDNSYGFAALKDGTTFAYNDQDLFRAGQDDVSFTSIDTGSDAAYEGYVDLDDGTVLFYGNQSAVRIDSSGMIVQELALGPDQRLYNHETTEDGTVLMYGRGSIYRYDPTGQAIEEFFVQGEIGFSNSAVLEDGSILIYGSGRVLRLTKAAEAMEVLFSSAEDRFFRHETLPDGSTLLFGGNSALVVARDGQVDLVTSQDDQNLDRIALLEDGSTLFYGDGTLLSTSEDRTSVKRHDLAVDARLYDHLALEGGDAFVYGEEGAIYYFNAADRTIEHRPSGTFSQLVGHALLQEGGQIFYSNTGAVTKFPGGMARRFEQLLTDINGVSEPDKDQAIRVFLQENLSNYEFAAKDDALNLINTIIAQRTVLATRKVETKVAQDNLPTGAYFLQQQRQSFRQFMQDCRGVTPVTGASDEQAATPAANGVAGDPDEITLACTQAWMKKLEAEAGTWWQTLAQQIPPGILLLFLLATLGALYRYNLRLAGFHASRADLLELMSMGQTNSKNMFVEWDKDNFSRITEALAADKVEFGKGTLPTDQAISMAQAILNR